jgi:hypothetical protein
VGGSRNTLPDWGIMYRRITGHFGKEALKGV